MGNWEIRNLVNVIESEAKIAKALDSESCKISFLQLNDKRKILKFKIDAHGLVSSQEDDYQI